MDIRPQLQRNPDAHRFEALDGDEIAGFIDYRERDGAWDLVHTQVQPAFEGQGLAATLAGFALDEARRAGRKVVPTCSYVARYIQRHPERTDLVA